MKIAGRRPMTAVRDAAHWSDGHLPFGVRSVLGLLLMVGGILGFLPILGFWMLPLGLALIALDIPGMRLRMLGWLDRVAAEREEKADRKEKEKAANR